MNDTHIMYADRPLFSSASPIIACLPGVLTIDPSTNNRGVRKPNGKYLSMNVNGTYSESDHVNAYEIVTVDVTVNLLRFSPNAPGQDAVTYAVPYWGV